MTCNGCTRAAEAAIKTLESYYYTYNGGELWEPVYPAPKKEHVLDADSIRQAAEEKAGEGMVAAVHKLQDMGYTYNLKGYWEPPEAKRIDRIRGSALWVDKKPDVSELLKRINYCVKALSNNTHCGYKTPIDETFLLDVLEAAQMVVEAEKTAKKPVSDKRKVYIDNINHCITQWEEDAKIVSEKVFPVGMAIEHLKQIRDALEDQ